MSPEKNRTVGRPRLSGAETADDPRSAILGAAADLFARQGYAGTSTREIAAAVGLRQPSLFHYFSSKEAILEGIIDALIGPSLSAFERLASEPGAPAVDLYAAVWADARQVGSMPEAARALMRTPELRHPRFRALRDSRDRLLAFYVRTIIRGQEAGELIDGEPSALAHLTVSLVESLVDPTFEPGDCDTYADSVADFAIRALLIRPAQLARIRAKARLAIGGRA